jgi:hypothetical protein
MTFSIFLWFKYLYHSTYLYQLGNHGLHRCQKATGREAEAIAPSHREPITYWNGLYVQLMLKVALLTALSVCIALYFTFQELGDTPWHMNEPIDNPKHMYDQAEPVLASIDSGSQWPVMICWASVVGWHLINSRFL